MSLINQALRDLEKRGAKPSGANPLADNSSSGLDMQTAQSGAGHTRPAINKAWVALGFVCVLAVGVLIGTYHQGESVQAVSNTNATSNERSNKATELAVAGDNQSNERPAVENVSAATKSTDARTDNGTDNRTDVRADVHAENSSVDEMTAQKTTTQESVSNQEIEEDRATRSVNERPQVVAVPKNAPKLNQNTEARTLNSDSGTVQRASVSSGSLVSASPASIDLKSAISARRMIERGELLKARTQLEQFIGENSVNDASKLELARVLVRLQDMQALDAMIERGDGFVQSEMRMIAARRALQKGDADSAYEVLRSTLPAIEQDPHYYALLASVEQRRGRHLQQVDLYRRLIVAHGDRAKWWLGSAIGLDKMQQYESARQAYLRAQQLNLSDPGLVAFVDQRLKQLRGQQ